METKTPIAVKVALITGILSLLTAISVTVIQSYAPSSQDLETLVKQMNNRVIPRIEKEINKLDVRYDYMIKELSKIKVRLTRLEERLSIEPNIKFHTNVDTADAKEAKPAKPGVLPRIQLQRRTTK